MKQMVCEMCGGTDLIKQDGVFICQTCGTKYSVEEAKKMMIEGNVDVSGSTVKVDNTDSVVNYLMMANNAYSSGNYKETEEYCNKIIEIIPAHSEAWLLKGIAAGWQTTGANIRMDEAISCVENAFSYADTKELLDVLGDRAYLELYNIMVAINKMKLDSVILYNTAQEYLNFYANFSLWMLKLQSIYGLNYKRFTENEVRNLSKEAGLCYISTKCCDMVADAANKMWNNAFTKYNESKYPSKYEFENMNDVGWAAICLVGLGIPSDTSKIEEESKKMIMKACKYEIAMREKYVCLKGYTSSFSNGYENHNVCNYITPEAQKKSTEEVRKLHEIIKICDPSYVIPIVSDPTPYIPKNSSSGGCYVATAVYGSYDCPQVWTLRRYRDNDLASTWYGRAFIHTYYAISPTLVKWFGHTEWFKKMWRGKLDRMVKDLQDKGYESTPYQDREWK